MAPLSYAHTNVLDNDLDQSARAPSPDWPRQSWARWPHPRLLTLAVGMLILGWAYWPNLQYLYTIWDNEPNYSHGKLVIPVALVIFILRLSESKGGWTAGHGPWWRQVVLAVVMPVVLAARALDDELGKRGPWWSWVVLAVVLAARALAYEFGKQWVETATIVPAVAAVVLTLGGWPLLRRGWPAAVFLVFMLNLPPAINDRVAMPLQRIATKGSVFVMQLTGLWVLAEGNIITLSTPFRPPHDRQLLEVAQACNGLSMLMTLFATVTATVILVPLANWKRLVILASAIPIALLSNIIRIVATGWCYYYIEGEPAKQFAHDWSGYLMMPLALILVGVELLILSWLAADGEEEDDQADVRPIDPILARLGGGKGKGTIPGGGEL